MVYDPRLHNPPPAFIYMRMLNAIITMEQSFMNPLHPHQIHGMVIDLRLMYSTVDYLGDWSQLQRVKSLISRARVKMFQRCQDCMLRCAVLVDACRRHQDSVLVDSCRRRQNSPATAMPSFDKLESAVLACDDVLQYLLPTMKQFYMRDLRPSLVAFMPDTECSSDCDSDGEGLPAAKHTCTGYAP